MECGQLRPQPHLRLTSERASAPSTASPTAEGESVASTAPPSSLTRSPRHSELLKALFSSLALYRRTHAGSVVSRRKYKASRPTHQRPNRFPRSQKRAQKASISPRQMKTSESKENVIRLRHPSSIRSGSWIASHNPRSGGGTYITRLRWRRRVPLGASSAHAPNARP